MADRSPGDFGRSLREARERRGVSLRQIANATKISMITLEALERNDIARLPGGIFSRGLGTPDSDDRWARISSSVNEPPDKM